MLEASGEGEASDDGGSDNEKGSSEASAAAAAARDPLKLLFKSITGGCDGVGQAFRRHFCQQALFRRTGAGAGGEAGGGEGGEGTGPPRWVADEEQEACMLCDRV